MDKFLKKKIFLNSINDTLGENNTNVFSGGDFVSEYFALYRGTCYALQGYNVLLLFNHNTSLYQETKGSSFINSRTELVKQEIPIYASFYKNFKDMLRVLKTFDNTDFQKKTDIVIVNGFLFDLTHHEININKHAEKLDIFNDYLNNYILNPSGKKITELFIQNISIHDSDLNFDFCCMADLYVNIKLIDEHDVEYIPLKYRGNPNSEKNQNKIICLSEIFKKEA